MSGGRVLLDSPIVIDALLGVAPAIALLDERPDRAISIITWIEVLAGAAPEDQHATKLFLRSFTRVELNEEVAEESVQVRRRLRLKLPDAIILASANVEERILLTRDAKDFGRLTHEHVEIPYRL